MTENWSLYHPEIPEFLRRLAETPPMARLRQVGMNCGCEYTSFPRFAGWVPYSRFDHSVGVGLIVWHFTGDLRQSAAGLLHDAATPAFAHVVDFLHGDHLHQESTEARTAELIETSPELQALLKEYGLTTEDVADYHRYPIADNDSPQLSADRLEYTLGPAVLRLRRGGRPPCILRRSHRLAGRVRPAELAFRTRRPPAPSHRHRSRPPGSMWRTRTASPCRPWRTCCAMP
ncbi:MAG: hypothetical protein ACLTYN_11880 [Dysosmobacter welbionis]